MNSQWQAPVLFHRLYLSLWRYLTAPMSASKRCASSWPMWLTAVLVIASVVHATTRYWQRMMCGWTTAPPRVSVAVGRRLCASTVRVCPLSPARVITDSSLPGTTCVMNAPCQPENSTGSHLAFFTTLLRVHTCAHLIGFKTRADAVVAHLKRHVKQDGMKLSLIHI